MDTTAPLLSRLQFAFAVSFHIIYPSFTIGLAACLTFLEALQALRLSAASTPDFPMTALASFVSRWRNGLSGASQVTRGG